MGDDNQLTQGLSGMAGGAEMGSMFGPWGAGIGGGLGLLMGLFGNQGAPSYQDQLKQLSQQYGSRQAPLLGQADSAADSGFRQQQAGLIQQLQSMAMGQGPSASALLMRQAMDQAAGAQASAAAGAGGRGVNQGEALRMAANNTAAVQAQGARDAGLMRVQEQLGAIGQLGGVLQGARGQDIGLNEFNAQQQNAFSAMNQQAKLQQEQLNQQGQMQALMAAMGAAGPGAGTQLLAGGSSAMPGILQWLSRGQGGGPMGGFGQAMGNAGPNATGYYGSPTDWAIASDE